MSSRKPTQFDKIIGIKIVQRRFSLGISQKKLANKVGMSFQQMQKYETGINRLSPEKLQRISAALEVPITYFFNDDGNIIMEKPSRHLMHLMQYLQDIESPELINPLKKLIKHLAEIERRARDVMTKEV